eukprot:3935167-Rhodomonas_salina.2
MTGPSKLSGRPSLSAYALATPCLVPTERTWSRRAMSGTDARLWCLWISPRFPCHVFKACTDTQRMLPYYIRACYAMSGTDLAHGDRSLPACLEA